MSIISLDILLHKMFKRNTLFLLKVLSVLGFSLGFFRVWIWWLQRRKEDEKLIGEESKPRRCLQGSRGVRGIKAAPHSRFGELQLGRTFYRDTRDRACLGGPQQLSAPAEGTQPGAGVPAAVPRRRHAGSRGPGARRGLSRGEPLRRRALRTRVGGTWSPGARPLPLPRPGPPRPGERPAGNGPLHKCPRAGRAHRCWQPLRPGSSWHSRPARPLCCAPPKSASRCAVPAGQEWKGREKSHLVGARVLPSLRPLVAPPWSEDGGPDSLRRVPDDDGQDLLSRRGGLCGGCDHLPAGHGQSPAPGSERDEDGEVSQDREGTPILCALLIMALV